MSTCLGEARRAQAKTARGGWGQPKSHSSKGGGVDNFNEIRFEDKKGAEEFHIQAEKNMTTLVKNDQSNTIKASRSSSTGGSDSVSVGGDRSLSVTGKRTVTVTKSNTWLFEPDTFAPMAKVVDGKPCSIVTDHMGTPVLMTHFDGSAAWTASISVYGDLRQVEGDRYACPFRWQGQYEDAETGLCYNRFRYYDADAGEYLTRDPIGLLGGLRPYGYVADPSRLIDPYGLTADELAAAIEGADRPPLDPGQTAHHIVKENADGMAVHSRDLLERNGVGVNDAPNGAALWGSHPDQVAAPNHPGRDAARATGNYHGGVHIHGKANDRLIYRILRGAEKRGIPIASVLEDIGRRMESGDWKTTGEGGCYSR